MKDHEEKHKIEVLETGTIIKGHHLKEGHVVELTAPEIDIHRDRGLRFGPVAEDDKREVFDLDKEPSFEEEPEGDLVPEATITEVQPIG